MLRAHDMLQKTELSFVIILNNGVGMKLGAFNLEFTSKLHKLANAYQNVTDQIITTNQDSDVGTTLIGIVDSSLENSVS